MASELLAMGLTKEEIKNLSCIEDKSLTASPDKNKPKQVKRKPKKMEKYIKDSNSDSSYGSADCYDFPRGIQNDTWHTPLGIVGGRGKPFNPFNNTYPGQASVAYNQFIQMDREIKPLLQNTQSAIFRNDYLEEKFNNLNTLSSENGIVGTEITNMSPELKICSKEREEEIPVSKNKEPTKELSETSQEKTVPTIKEPEKLYLDVLNRNMDQSNVEADSKSSSDIDRRRKIDVKVKTQLYIPPHMRNRMVQAQSSTSACSVDVSSSSILSEVSSTSDKNNHFKNCDTEKSSSPSKVSQDVLKEPSKPKKTVAELCKKNVLLSGLLRKNKAAAQSTSTSTARSDVSTPTSMSLTDVSSASTLSHVSSTSDKPAHYNHYDTDPWISHRTEPAPISSCFPENLVDFNDLVPPPHCLASPLGSSPLAPPPEFQDSDGETHCYFDPETQDFVTYQIPREPVDCAHKVVSENGFASGQSQTRTSTIVPDASWQKGATGKSQTGSPLKSTESATHGPASNNIHPSFMLSYTTRPGSAFSSVTPRLSPGILPGPPINPGSAVSYATASRGFWPDPGEEDFDYAYPPLK